VLEKRRLNGDAVPGEMARHPGSGIRRRPSGAENAAIREVVLSDREPIEVTMAPIGVSRPGILQAYPFVGTDPEMKPPRLEAAVVSWPCSVFE